MKPAENLPLLKNSRAERIVNFIFNPVLMCFNIVLAIAVWNGFCFTQAREHDRQVMVSRIEKANTACNAAYPGSRARNGLAMAIICVKKSDPDIIFGSIGPLQR